MSVGLGNEYEKIANQNAGHAGALTTNYPNEKLGQDHFFALSRT
jgi:hypothetical protein